MMGRLLAFYTDIRNGFARSARTILAAVAVSGFAWAMQFTDSPRLANALKVATIMAILWVAAHDGKPTEPAP